MNGPKFLMPTAENVMNKNTEGIKHTCLDVSPIESACNEVAMNLARLHDAISVLGGRLIRVRNESAISDYSEKNEPIPAASCILEAEIRGHSRMARTLAEEIEGICKSLAI